MNDSSDKQPAPSRVKSYLGAAAAGAAVADRYGFDVLRSDKNYNWRPSPDNPFKGGTPHMMNEGAKGLDRIRGKRWPFVVGGAVAAAGAAHIGHKMMQRKQQAASEMNKKAGAHLSAYAEVGRRASTVSEAARRLTDADKTAGVAGGLFSAARMAMGSRTPGKMLASEIAGRSVARRAGSLAWKGLKSDVGMGTVMGGVGGAMSAEKGNRLKGATRGAAVGAASGAVSGHVQKKVDVGFARKTGDGIAKRFGKAVVRNPLIGASAVAGLASDKVFDKGLSAVGFKSPPQKPDDDAPAPPRPTSVAPRTPRLPRPVKI